MSIGLIVAGGLAAYALSRKRAVDDVDEPGAELRDRMDKASEPFEKLIDDLAKQKSEDPRYFGPMLVTVKLRVSGIEKFFSSESTLKKAAKKFARQVQAELPTRCPGAPKLMSEPRLTFKDVDGGYKVGITWVAQWSHKSMGPLRERVKNCILKIVRENKDIGDRVKSLTAIRLS